MGKNDTRDTIFYVLSDEMIRKLILDLQLCLKQGAQSALLISSNKEDFDDKMQELAASLAGASLDQIPEPDIICTSAIYTIGLPTTLAALMPVVQRWAMQTGLERLGENPNPDEPDKPEI